METAILYLFGFVWGTISILELWHQKTMTNDGLFWSLLVALLFPIFWARKDHEDNGRVCDDDVNAWFKLPKYSGFLNARRVHVLSRANIGKAGRDLQLSAREGRPADTADDNSASALLPRVR